MKRFYSPFFAAASLSAALLAGCQGGRRSIGLVLGDPTGLCYRQEISRDEAVTVGVDLGGLERGGVHFFVDWIRYEPSWQGREFFVYWGLGVDVKADPEIRVPLGLDLDLSRSGDIVLFLQVVPKVPFENTDLHFDLALGILFGF